MMPPITSRRAHLGPASARKPSTLAFDMIHPFPRRRPTGSADRGDHWCRALVPDVGRLYAQGVIVAIEPNHKPLEVVEAPRPFGDAGPPPRCGLPGHGRVGGGLIHRLGGRRGWRRDR